MSREPVAKLYPSVSRLLVQSLLGALQLMAIATDQLLAQNTVDRARPTREPAQMVIGLPGIAPRSQGFLKVDAAKVYFQSLHGSVEIDRNSITDIDCGDERIETGGKPGKIARLIVPYGGGQAIGAFTHKKVKLLTVEFVDAKREYHGVVFVLTPRGMDQIMATLDQLPRFDSSSGPDPAVCAGLDVKANSIRIEPIQMDIHSKLVPAVRVLLYEDLVRQFESEPTISSVYRAGDSSREAQCAQFAITIQAAAFHKGDQAVRAEVGPLGAHFFGTTRLRYHVTILARDRSPIIDKDMKKAEGGDSDSLNITEMISKSIVKDLDRLRKHSTCDQHRTPGKPSGSQQEEHGSAPGPSSEYSCGTDAEA